ncbi:fumarylacetoacetate hydrolase family protein [Gimibacter soli]|uniref:Fumarylacetoacetate hydrolase family protein n=1 Tax=Gimibacter soli TaxID=3024400 RepID=A0AAF0BKZ1_9PROT|nr:fumarylacetoacetate hydrolase family protein [Gimibacter soli]WCL53522.1 fumarylacetoacetate hydrolase family protein [Gimibacter soli]
MTDFVIPAPVTTSVPVDGTDARFPVHRIYCVGRNYADHVREMGGDPKSVPPTFFSKPADALVTDGADAAYPPMTADLHFEIELVVALKSGGANIAEADALSHVFGYAVGNDLTRRDLQGLAKKGGSPWDMAKGFDQSAPIGSLVPAAKAGHPATGRIWLSVDGAVRQDADLGDMIWSVPAIIAELSRFVTLAPGDLIFTGTPAGVGAVTKGALIEGGIDGVGTLRHRIA